jgi:hypothetical protein
MRYSVVSSAGSGSVNEDLVMVREGNGVTDIIVMDGATPLTPQRWIGAGASDPAWFVRQFAADLCALLQMDGSQDSLVRQALGATRDAWRRHARGNPPPYAWPVATLSWVRVRAGRLELYCLGDCKTLLLRADGSVRPRPLGESAGAVVQDAIAALVREGVDDPAARREAPAAHAQAPPRGTEHGGPSRKACAWTRRALRRAPLRAAAPSAAQRCW